MKLIFPCNDYMLSYIEAYKEDDLYRKNSEETFTPPEEVIEEAINYSEGINMRPGHVKCLMMWIVEEDEFIGTIGIRPELNERLKKYGGHIGYQIRMHKWYNGYGTKALALSLLLAKEKFGLQRVLLVCNDDNIASGKVIENNGGLLESKIEKLRNDGSSVIIRRYWINIK